MVYMHFQSPYQVFLCTFVSTCMLAAGLQLNISTGVDVIYRFSSISRSAREILKFPKQRSALEIHQKYMIVHHFGQ